MTPPVGTADAATGNANGLYDAKTAIAYAAYAASDDILLVSDIAGRTPPGLPTDLLTTWSDYKHKNTAGLVPVLRHVRNPRANLIQELLLAEKRSPARHVSVLLDASHLVNTVPALYHLAGSREGAGRGAVATPAEALARTTLHIGLPSWGATAQALAFVSHVAPFAVLLAPENDPQEAHDLSLVAHHLASATLPVALLTSALGTAFEKISHRVFKTPEPAAVDPAEAVAHAIAALDPAPSPRPYTPFSYHGPTNATQIVVVPNTAPRVLDSVLTPSVGVLRVRAVRPWTPQAFLAALPSTATHLAVLEASVGAAGASTTGLGFGQLFLDVAASFHTGEWTTTLPVLKELRVKLAPTQLLDAHAAAAILDAVRAALRSDAPSHDLDARSSAASPVTATVGIPTSDPVLADPAVEQPYLALLSQLFGARLDLANVIDADTAAVLEGPAADAGISAEFGLGLHLARIRQRDDAVRAVRAAVADPRLPPTLAAALNAWLAAAPADVPARGAAAAEALEALARGGSHPNDAVAGLVAAHPNLAALLAAPVPTRWVLGGDRLAYDVGTSGVHHLLASGANVKLLLLDTQPYSAKRAGDVRKKDVGLYAMTYGNAYVAGVSLQANYAGVVRALQEAEAFEGPAVVLAYAPRVEVGRGGVVRGGGGIAATAALAALKEVKLAVDEGYWPLFRWNPSAATDQERFRLDSERLREEVKGFLERDAHLALVAEEQAEPEMTPSAEEEIRRTMEDKIRESYQQLLASLNAMPVLVAYGSDGGNAAAMAKRLAGEARSRGLKPKVAVMDEVGVEGLAKHKHVVFVVSTAGQGEFPGNARETWRGLQQAKADEASLAGTKFAVFAMGDSHYWPLPEDAHYFCKSGKDLDARLGALGAQRMLEVGLGDDRAPDGPMTAYRAWTPDLWSALGVGAVEVSDTAAAAAGPTDDAVKEASNFLRGSIAAGLKDASTGQLAELDTKITKFHGIYQQDDRDVRDARARAGLEKAFSFMIRVRVPGGVSTPEQWLQMDEIADKYANGTLKLTTRQTFQFHGVVKSKLKKTMQEINKSLMDTIAACGDVNRNVMCNPIPNHSSLHADVFEFTKKFSEHLLPKTNAYHEIWLDKKVVLTSEDHEPIYGKTYLPRKFKVAVAVPPHNDVDVFAHDLGYIAIEENGRLVGFNVTVGGGMGMTHGMKTTYPRLGDVIGFCTVEQAIDVGEKVVLVQRDFGDRTNRKHARLKYTIDDRGIEWFVAEVEARLGYKLEPARAYKFVSNGDRYGWIRAQDGTWSYTLFVQNGRVKDTTGQRYKTGLREVARCLQRAGKTVSRGGAAPEFRLSPNQNLLISNVPEAFKPEVEKLLADYGIENGNLSGLRLNSMACVALPTCALAMAESERYLPDLVGRIEGLLEENGLRDDAITIRMTGCPNGCARPQIAEIAFVGKAPGSYNMYLGGGHNGERLNKIYKESVGEEEILKALAPIVKDYAISRIEGEHFGDFVIRKGYVKATIKGKDFHDV
ncbi:hypothetical protein HDU96_003197 [Phlyctochytrium bullatum]|nr:hypothetical protein HDU96_003197 [Phlyctochytrium bullatum]